MSQTIKPNDLDQKPAKQDLDQIAPNIQLLKNDKNDLA